MTKLKTSYLQAPQSSSPLNSSNNSSKLEPKNDELPAAVNSAGQVKENGQVTSSATNGHHIMSNEMYHGRRSSGDLLHQRQQVQHQRRHSGLSRQYRGWRSCWNGNQLDVDLLYKTVKAQEERRLADLLASSQLAEDQTASQQVPAPTHYAAPKPAARRTQPVSGNSIGTSDRLVKDEQVSQDNEADNVSMEDNPLSDPLYASILGTSKQLQSSQWRPRELDRLRPSPAEFNASCFRYQVSRGSASTSFVGQQPSKKSAQHREAQDNRNLHLYSGTGADLERLTKRSQAHDEQSDDDIESDCSDSVASLQLRSLVEKCLEVQRATRNGNCLLISKQDYQEQQQLTDQVARQKRQDAEQQDRWKHEIEEADSDEQAQV